MGLSLAARLAVSRLPAAAIVLAILSAVAGVALADLIGHGAPVREVTISADGKRALSAAFDDQVILWDLDKREPSQRLIGHEAAVNAVLFLPPDERQALSAGDDGTLRLWNLEKGSEIATWRGHEKKVVGLAATPDGRYVMSASWDRSLRLWDLSRGTTERIFEVHDDSVNAVAYSARERAFLSAGYDGTLWLLPLAAAEEPRRLAATGFPIGDLATDASGARILTGSADGMLRLWDPAAETPLLEIAAHEGAILTVAIAPDGETLASGGTDGRLLLWQAADGKVIRDLGETRFGAVWSIAFSADGAKVYGAGIDSVIRAWHRADGRPVAGDTLTFQPIDRVAASAADSEDPLERGAFHFRKCAVCHSLRGDSVPRAGPSLQGLFGRRVGTYPGYRYSEALRRSDLVWTEETVSQLFELGPDVLLPGTKMPLQRLPDARARADLIAFLKQYSEAP